MRKNSDTIKKSAASAIRRCADSQFEEIGKLKLLDHATQLQKAPDALQSVQTPPDTADATIIARRLALTHAGGATLHRPRRTATIINVLEATREYVHCRAHCLSITKG